MNKMQKLAGILLMGLAIVIIWTVEEPAAPTEITCEQKKQIVEASIASGNHCVTGEDCTSFMACPFGCQIPVNKTELAGLQQAINDYYGQCVICEYQCPLEIPVVCREGKCVKESNEQQ